MVKKDNKQRLFEIMSKIDNSFKLKLNENDINESGFSRLKQMMHGLVESVNTLGIITAENPNNVPLSPNENKRRNEELKNMVKNELNLGYIQPDFGVYNVKEKPIIIQNINKDDLIMLGDKFEQESVIFGEKNEDNQGVYFKWEYIEHGNTINDETVYTNITGKDVDDRDDYYTQMKGRKFVIPFFDKMFYRKPQPEFKHSKDIKNLDINRD